MQSLSPECTPLKHRYDTCFNLWFEGYLQPALDGRPVVAYPSTTSSAPSTPSSSSSATSAVAPPPATQANAEEERKKKPLITSWAASIARRSPVAPRQSQHAHFGHHGQAADVGERAGLESQDHPQGGYDVEEFEIDTTGKTRAQIKAEEYDRACGALWKDYQGCLQKSIKENESLSVLLEQAREEHPLKSMDKLEGTAWDPKTNPADVFGKD
ncbi:hypothetical protein, variant [Cryptococcus amylolentus CBS 6039]|uniref:Mitochondrial distribution and morphology protein 35 n=2 Tax=Cryptococcus amylolentus TaxID=104669 RepID=A0A1E3I4C3_9TREE|nr:hypothetical protein, variant [Cryptococcus amylolentus CBS 6039]ODN83225.1 hypothetical protein, variant [Cryptococcus amylolentus CBS 6039]ODO10796.1 hypothetical protein I350_01394 [Cryptococcus amylolentus CBS 6273]